MRRWYFPTWHGDLRLERAEVPEETLLTIVKPTADEQRILNKIGPALVDKGWLESWTVEAHKKRFFGKSTRSIRIKAPIEAVGPVVVAIMRPGPATLTCIKLEGGRVDVVSAGALEKGKLVLEGDVTLGMPYHALPVDTEPVVEAQPTPAPPPPKPEAAVTVKRPTPSCPECEVGAVGPASEVLLEFLDAEQHAQWAEKRTLVVYGGYTGRPYLLAHRHTAQAARQGRICMDLSLGGIVHFHDRTVPPEEEVLAAKLILEHREDWLRNEATMLGGFCEKQDVFKNPFGDILDGVEDAELTRKIGEAFGAPAARLTGVDMSGYPIIE